MDEIAFGGMVFGTIVGVYAYIAGYLSGKNAEILQYQRKHTYSIPRESSIFWSRRDKETSGFELKRTRTAMLFFQPMQILL